MNRLTERDEYGNADIIGVDSADIQINLNYSEFTRVTVALNRLAEYEDIGLTPDEIINERFKKACMDEAWKDIEKGLDELMKYREEIAAGRLVAQPCKEEGKRMTHADKIRAMTDEEIASFMEREKNTIWNCPPGKGTECPDADCHTCWLEWLRQEVTDRHKLLDD